jgi:hypothetical protein
MKKILSIAGFLVVLGLVAWTISVSKGRIPQGGSVSNEADSAVRATVKEFGAALKSVSLQAPPATIPPLMDEHYGRFVTPELLAMWKANPETAPGRMVSSPWPDRIEVAFVNEVNEMEYNVEGNIIEVTSDSALRGEIAAVQPVELTLKKINNEWRIADLEKGAYSKIPERATLTGVYTCLPHRNTNGPQTLECALGIKTDNGAYYALNAMLLSSTDVWNTLQTGERIRIEGPLVPVEQLSTDIWQKYNIKGIMNVTSVQRVSSQ